MANQVQTTKAVAYTLTGRPNTVHATKAVAYLWLQLDNSGGGGGPLDHRAFTYGQRIRGVS